MCYVQLELMKTWRILLLGNLTFFIYIYNHRLICIHLFITNFICNTIHVYITIYIYMYRFGFGRFTTIDEVEYTAAKCIKHVQRLREMRLVF